MGKLSNIALGDYACNQSAVIHRPKETSWLWAGNVLQDGMLSDEFLHFQILVKPVLLTTILPNIKHRHKNISSIPL